MAIDPAEGEVWSDLPRFSRRGLDLERRIDAWMRSDALASAFAWLTLHGLSVSFDRAEVEFRPSALKRPAVIAQLRWPRLRTRLAVGIETTVAHAVVDELLGFDRPLEATRLQTTPVEWGVWTYLIGRLLEEFQRTGSSPFRWGGKPEADAFDLSIDRVGPGDFEVEGLGEIVTVRWAVRVGKIGGAVRLWLPASLASYWIDEPTPARGPIPPGAVESASEWRAVLGTSPLPMGLRRLRINAVLPVVDSQISGPATDPMGALDLVCDSEAIGEYRIPVEFESGSAGRFVRVQGPLTLLPRHSGEPVMSKAPSPVVDPLDAPVTLTVELGRVSLPLSRLADLKPGDVIELGRRGREPVEITSNGRIVARGDLILIDAELGVRVTSVLL